MKKKLLFTLLSTLACTLGAADFFNGGFEICTPNSAGVAMPAHWISNRVVTKNGTARLTKDPGCFRSGVFGLLTETEKDGRLYFRSLKTVRIKSGDFIEMEIYHKGSGKFTLQYIAYGVEDAQHSKFLSTLGTGKPLAASEEDWKQHRVKVKFIPPKRAQGKYTDFSILPVIMVYSDAEIVFDDFKLKVIPAK